ncbi:hypothetical protein AHYW_002615 [Providencia manganoxydans]|uniref:phage tail tape measure protein n=1 Tax=Providencia manganoxydans TaxID=2923283 RepID=UPI003DA05C34
MSRMLELAWKLSGKMDGSLSTATKKATASISNIGKAAGKVQAQVGGISKKIIGISAALTGGALGGGGIGFLMLAKNAATAGAELNSLSKQVGISSGTLSQWSYAAGSVGIAQEQFSDSTKKLNKNMALAAQGSKTAQLAFRRAGISIYSSSGKLKSSDQMISELSDVFKKMPEGIYKADLAVALFGQSGAAMVPLLEKGSKSIAEMRQEGLELGLVFSDAEAAMAGEFADGLDYAKNAAAGIASTLGRKLLPVLLPVVQQVNEWIKANRGLINSKIDAVINKVSEAISALKGYLPELIDNIRSGWAYVDGIVQSMGGWQRILKLIAGAFVVLKGLQFVSWVAGLASGMGGLVTAFRVAIPVIIKFGAALLANPIGLVIAAIAALVAAGYFLWKNWDDVVAGIKAVWENVKAYFVGAIQDVITAFDGGFINGMIEIFKKFDPVILIARAINAVIKYITGVDLMDSGAKFIGSFADGLLNYWNKIKGTIVDAVTGWLPDWIMGGSETVVPDVSLPAYANGGLVTRPQIAQIGEAGREMVIPLTRPSRGRALVSQAAAELGMTEDRTALASMSGASMAPNNITFPAFSPQITVTGADNPQAVADKISSALESKMGEFKRMMGEFMYQQQRKGVF